MANEQKQEDPWSRRMAEVICLIDDHSELCNAIEAAMEAAAEMKSVRLKILLAECHGVLYEAGKNDACPTHRVELLPDIRVELGLPTEPDPDPEE